MNTDELRDEFRAVDDIEVGVDVDQLVADAARKGRRRVVRQRSLSVLAGAALVLGIIALASSLTLGVGRSSAPAAPPTPTATPTVLKSVAPEPSPMPPTPTHAEVLAALKANLPAPLEVSAAEGMTGESSVTMTLSDARGRAWAGGGIGSSAELRDMPCRAAQGCTKTPLQDGVLSTSRDQEKVGDGVWYYFERSDGRYVWFGQRNAFEGNGPVTRPSLPLTDRQVRALLTAPEWDTLADQCRPDPAPSC